MVKFSYSHQRPDMFAVDGLRFQDSFYLRVVPFERLVVILLARRHLSLDPGNLFLELLLAPDRLFQGALYAVKPLTAAIPHVGSLPPQRSIELPTDISSPVCA